MYLPRLAVLTMVLALPISVRAADLDPYLPVDTESCVTVNVRQLLDAPVVKKQLLAVAREGLKELGEVNDVLKDLNFDPFKDLEKITIATPGGTEGDRGLVIIRGNFDLDKFKKKAEDTAGNNEAALKIHKIPLGEGATHTVYQVVIPNQDMSLYVALVDKTTILVSPGKDYVVDALKQARTKTKLVLKNKDFQTLLEKMDAKLTLSIAMLGKTLAGGNNDVLPPAVTEALGSLEAIGGGIAVSNEFKLEIVVVGKDEDSARSLREITDKGVKLGLVGLALLGEERKELSLLLEVIKTIKVTGRGKTVAMSARLTADVLEEFFKKDE